jgi:hypothetical protein
MMVALANLGGKIMPHKPHPHLGSAFDRLCLRQTEQLLAQHTEPGAPQIDIMSMQIGTFIQAINGSRDVPTRFIDDVFVMIHGHWRWMQRIRRWKNHDSFLMTLKRIQKSPPVCQLVGHLVKKGHWIVFWFHSLITANTGSDLHAAYRLLQAQIAQLDASITRHSLTTCMEICVDVCALEHQCRVERSQEDNHNNFFAVSLVELIDCAEHISTRQFHEFIHLTHAHPFFFASLSKAMGTEYVLNIGKLPAKTIATMNDCITHIDHEKLALVGFDQQTIMEFCRQSASLLDIERAEDEAFKAARQLAYRTDHTSTDVLRFAVQDSHESWHRAEPLFRARAIQKKAVAITHRINKNLEKYLRRFKEDHELLALVIKECGLQIADFALGDTSPQLDRIIDQTGGIKKLAQHFSSTSGNNAHNDSFAHRPVSSMRSPWRQAPPQQAKPTRQDGQTLR